LEYASKDCVSSSDGFEVGTAIGAFHEFGGECNVTDTPGIPVTDDAVVTPSGERLSSGPGNVVRAAS
jgi:hypothetical protein